MPSRLIPRLLVVFTQQLEILVSMMFNISILVYYMQLISSQMVDVSGPLLRRARSLLLISSQH